LVTPTSPAMSSIVTAAKPRWAKRPWATSSVCSMRSSRDSRVRRVMSVAIANYVTEL
jgi:hypothetical protein